MQGHSQNLACSGCCAASACYPPCYLADISLTMMQFYRRVACSCRQECCAAEHSQGRESQADTRMPGWYNGPGLSPALTLAGLTPWGPSSQAGGQFQLKLCTVWPASFRGGPHAPTAVQAGCMKPAQRRQHCAGGVLGRQGPKQQRKARGAHITLAGAAPQAVQERILPDDNTPKAQQCWP